MSSVGAAPCAAPISNARAEASRRNGAKSRGPKTQEGKARSAQNALKHGFRAQKYVLLPQENAAAFRELEAALIEELAPEGAFQSVLAQRIVAATWRLARAERLEAELFEERQLPGRSLGLALIRDCNGARAFETLLRYRGGALAEVWRALRTLKALQAERQAQAARAASPAPAPSLPRMIESAQQRAVAVGSAQSRTGAPSPRSKPIEPESRTDPRASEPTPAASEPAPARLQNGFEPGGLARCETAVGRCLPWDRGDRFEPDDRPMSGQPSPARQERCPLRR